ncbi:MAG TPA: ribosome biogenesis GTPase YqeH [Pseudogracilibacillus sp.]|nr:ribosome biogenesis GTPase YqeH [Pseudogracilibacillus sp.]
MASNIICDGCGVQLQTDHKNKIGYIPKSSLQNNPLFCQRCFQLRHYNKQQTISLDSNDFLNMVSQIRKTDSLVIHLIDIFDVDGTLLKSLPRIVGDNPILLVGNKIDLLPKSTNERKLKHWLFKKAKDSGMNVVDVYLISSLKSHYLDELAKDMEMRRKKKDIYVVGVTNVGKSTFINQFIKRSTGIKEAITTSYFPGTTLGFIQIPLDERSALIDTPGIVNKQQMAHYVSKEDLKTITPKKEIKPRNYQLNSGQTLFIGGLARIDFVKGNKQTLVCYFANEVPVHRTKLENAQPLYERQIGKLLVPPNEESLQTLPSFTKHSYRLTEPYTDVVFPGLGWITILDGHVTVDAYSPKGVAVSIRKSFK